MAYADAQKILYGAYMLSEEAECWWDNVRHRFEANGKMITQVVFKGAFLEKYFPVDVRGKKEVEFLELKQGNMTVADYASKFEELSRFCPHHITRVSVTKAIEIRITGSLMLFLMVEVNKSSSRKIMVRRVNVGEVLLIR